MEIRKGVALPGARDEETRMTPERWQQVKAIFDGAVECSSASRIAYIRERCGKDEELRREVESLLASDAPTGSFLNGCVAKKPHAVC